LTTFISQHLASIQPVSTSIYPASRYFIERSRTALRVLLETEACVCVNDAILRFEGAPDCEGRFDGFVEVWCDAPFECDGRCWGTSF
jgi:hypothetical protein